jgi:hypothetical protein
MEVEKYIREKVKLFTNQYYFQIFNTILINLSKNISIYEKQTSLFQRTDFKIDNNWYFIMQIVLDKLKSKDKPYYTENNLNINPLVFSYLVKLCKSKVIKLLKLSNRENAPMENLLRLYLDLCDQSMNPEKYEYMKKKEKQKEESSNKNKWNNNNSSKLHSSTKMKLILKKNELNSLNDINQITRNENATENNSEQDEDEDNNVQKKYGIGKIKLLYCNSLSRLFIGETDERTIREKYLMNITVKKEQKLGGINMGISDSYIKGIMKEIYREKVRNKGVIVDQNLVKIIDKFKKEQKVLEDYKKSLNLLKSYNSPKKTSKTRVKLFNNLKIYNSYNKKNQASISCFDFKESNNNYKIDDYKKRKINLKLKVDSNFENYSSNPKKWVIKSKDQSKYLFTNRNKYIDTRNILKSSYYSNLQKKNKKIAKFLLNKYKSSFVSSNKKGFKNYMTRNDFYYNNDI